MKRLSPNDFGIFLVEDFTRLSLKKIIDTAKAKLKESLVKSELEAEGQNLSLEGTNLHYGGVRLWFKCPGCQGRCSILFRHPITQVLECRKCLNLKYRKGRYKGMIENSLSI